MLVIYNLRLIADHRSFAAGAWKKRNAHSQRCGGICRSGRAQTRPNTRKGGKLNRVVVTANLDSLRAFRLVPASRKGHLEFDVSEINPPPETAVTHSVQDVEHRLREMARRVNELIASENPESWILAAPLCILVYLLPFVNEAVKNCLAGVKLEDMTALPAKRIARRFEPSSAFAEPGRARVLPDSATSVPVILPSLDR